MGSAVGSRPTPPRGRVSAAEVTWLEGDRGRTGREGRAVATKSK